jgi:hypothetical protein
MLARRTRSSCPKSEPSIGTTPHGGSTITSCLQVLCRWNNKKVGAPALVTGRPATKLARSSKCPSIKSSRRLLAAKQVKETFEPHVPSVYKPRPRCWSRQGACSANGFKCDASEFSDPTNLTGSAKIGQDGTFPPIKLQHGPFPST